MRNLILLPFTIVVLLFSSCSAYHTITVEDAAKVIVPEGIRVIGVINNITHVGTDKSGNPKVSEQLKTRNTATSAMVINGSVNSILARNGRAKVFESDSVMHANGGIDWILLDSIARVDSIDLFIELNEFKASATIGAVVLSAVTGQPATQSLKGTLSLNMRLPQSKNLSGEHSVDGSVTYPVSGNLVNVDADIRQKRNAYERLGYNLGFASSELMYSHQVSLRRKYYKYGSPAINDSRSMMQRRNWSEAEKILLKNVDDGKAGPRGRTLYNLAFIKEAQGDLDKAIEYAERSAFECFNTEGKLYLKKLQERKGISDEYAE